MLSYKDLKAGKVYAAGKQGMYLFIPYKDSHLHFTHRVTDDDCGKQDGGYVESAGVMVVKCEFQNHIREATPEEEAYMQACIVAKAMLPFPLKPVVNNTYKIF